MRSDRIGVGIAVGAGAGPDADREEDRPTLGARVSGVGASPRQVLEAFFEAENKRDWEAYERFLHPEVEWRIGGRTVTGRADYLRAMRAAYAGSDSCFRLHQAIESADGRVVATLLIDSQGNRSLDVFEVVEGLIRREWEFLLGPGPGW